MTDIDLQPLDSREHLPDALRILIESYPRESWETHPNFAGLVQFWLERHLMFRKLIGTISHDVDKVLDGKMPDAEFRPRLSRFGNILLGQLHEHHTIEDTHYFPKLVPLDRRIERGFELLDSDHHALDGFMQGFAEGANGVLQVEGKPSRDTVAAFQTELARFGGLIHRHLEDEEDLIVPVLLKHGAPGL
ncbi:hemerythrin domain-containing protein [Anianabacter salinae]|uniref:hemerythrin domain-containing protein n=1 Tax=Anianabacter salinae TaxID=2851023 RepID=UPI00225E3912|nr:hemerythrin domain-containing protein [Anianabacter salinae]MBV0911013.1 hemerythrin domain-containing protein [Anianabacter salinae]